MEFEIEKPSLFRTIETAPEPESRWAFKCPAWAMVVIHNGVAKFLASCGRYFDYSDDDLIYLEDEKWEEPNGVYIAEGGWVSSVDWESGIDEGGWEPGDIRPITAEEWEQFREEDEPWPPEFYADPVQKLPTVMALIPAASLVENLDRTVGYGENLVECCHGN